MHAFYLICMHSAASLSCIWFDILYEEFGVLGEVLGNCIPHAVEIRLW
jgi:hypothetical protein